MQSLHEIILNLKKRGKPLLGCFPLYPPLELFHSMGMIPLVLWGLGEYAPGVSGSDRHVQGYACSVARRLAEFVLSDAGTLLDGIFMYNACDTLRNLPEILECGLRDRGRAVLPIVKMHVPAVSPAQGSAGADYIRKEISRLIADMEKTFGRSFSGERFKESAALYRDLRRRALEAERLVAAGVISASLYQQWAVDGCLSPVEEQILSLQSLLKGSCGDPRTPQREPGRVIISGIVPPPPAVTRAMEEAGLVIAGNDIALMHRSFARTPAADDDPAGYYADFYRDHFPCTTLLPTSDERVAALEGLVSGGNARGLVFIGEKFCEYEYLEMPFIEKHFNDRGIKTLQLEISMDDVDPAALKTRVQAFAEMLG